MEDILDVVVIGAGVVGLSVAKAILAKNPSYAVAVVDKAAHVGQEQSSHNSGVIHSGLYYKHGSLKAQMCVAANERLYAFAAQNDIPHKRTGKLTVAPKESDIPLLEDLYHRGVANGVPGIQWIDENKISSYEPNVVARAAVLTPFTGIIDPARYMKTLECLVTEQGAMIQLKTKVDAIIYDSRFSLSLSQGSDVSEVESRYVVNAAGLFGDEIARMVNPSFPFLIRPVKGEYVKFYHTARSDIGISGMNIYPVSRFVQVGNEKKEMTGVHITPTLDENGDISKIVQVGPLSHAIFDKSDYSLTKSLEEFYGYLKEYFPNIRLEDLQPHETGIQAKPLGVDDFILERDHKIPAMIHALAASPGLTCAELIGEKIAEIID